MVENALTEINRPEFRAQLGGLLGRCSTCGEMWIHQALSKAFEQKETYLCSERQEQELATLAATLLRFWELIGAPPEELKGMLNTPHLELSLERLLRIIHKWGMHYPLIIPTTVKWEITNSCNLRCRHCLVNGGPRLRNELSTEEALALIDQCLQAGVRNLGLLGGEPLLRKDLFTLIDYASSKGMDVSLSTNAIEVTEAVAEQISGSTLQDVAVSVDGIRETHDQFRGLSGAYEKTVQGIKNLVKCKVPVTISAVISKYNIHQLGEIIDLAVELGAAKFAANDLQPIGRGQALREKCLSQEDFDRLGEIVDERREHYGKQIKLVWIGVGNSVKQADHERGPLLLSKCGAGLSELTVGSDGTVRGCPFLQPTTENIREKDLETIWFTSPQVKVYQERTQLKGKCGKCQIKFSCSGCRARAESFLNDVMGPDLRCSLNYTC